MNIDDKDKANKHILPKKPELNDDMYNWVIAKYGKPNTWTDSQFHSIADDDQQGLHADTDVIKIGSSSSERECSNPSELECSSTSELECLSILESKLSSYVSSYDESSSSDESGCLEKSVPKIDKDDDETDEQDDEIDKEAEDGKMILMMSYGVQKPLEQLIRNLSVQK
ncbi:hypothetical protein Tco_1048010 [Tanacetum coccineum]